MIPTPDMKPVIAALERVAQVQVAAVAARLAADAEARPLFEEADRLRAEAIKVHLAAVERHGVGSAERALREADEASKKAFADWQVATWTAFRTAVPTRTDTPRPDAPNLGPKET